MKAANLLISAAGELKIADFGLARAFDPAVERSPADFRGRERKYTNCVVTRWYRPPELLLGARQYGGAVDLWGVGCVLGEMFTRRPILAGASDLEQLERIWQLCGTPNQHTWPNFDDLPGCEGVKRFATHQRKIKQVYEGCGPYSIFCFLRGVDTHVASYGVETCDLLDRLLTCNPRDRITASEALEHDYFWTDPLPADANSCVPVHTLFFFLPADARTAHGSTCSTGSRRTSSTSARAGSRLARPRSSSSRRRARRATRPGR
jgi:serine/threonine-protein kinase BUR1